MKFYDIAKYLTIAVVFCHLGAANARTIFVSKSGDGTDGSTWIHAFSRVTDAILSSATGDEIRVEQGTYVDRITLSTPVTLLGGYSISASNVKGENTPNGKTVIDGNGGGTVLYVTKNLTLKRVDITNGFSGGAAGIRMENGTFILDNCNIYNNHADDTAGAMGCADGTLQMYNCGIFGNVATRAGGGIVAINADISITNCIIRNNYCPGTPGEGVIPPFPGEGGGLYLNGAKAVVTNCLFYDNDAESGADIFYREVGSLECVNCTFGSTAYPNIFKRPFAPTSGPTHFSNSIFWGHANPFEGEDWIVTHSNVARGFPGDGNIDEDPLFVDPQDGDFHLQAGSPCIDSASTTGPATDLDGNPRPFDVPGVGRDGTGDEFDMGAYEFIPTPSPTMVDPRSDIDQNGKVDSLDLLILIADWKKMTTSMASPEEDSVYAG